MRKYKIVEEKSLNGDCEYAIYWHSPLLWKKDRWVPESYYTNYKIRKIMKFATLQEAKFYINVRYAPKMKKVVTEGVI